MNQPDMFIRRIADYQILNVHFYSNVGLLDGKMGIALFFFFCSRYTRNEWYEEFAGELLDDVCSNLHVNLPVNFSDGLCGIGWAIEFMKKQGFIEADTDEVLSNIDRIIMERDLCRMADITFETGLEGVAAYVRSRIDSHRIHSCAHPFDSMYLESLDNACQKANIKWRSERCQTDFVWQRVMDVFTASPFSVENRWKKVMNKIAMKHE